MSAPSQPRVLTRLRARAQEQSAAAADGKSSVPNGKAGGKAATADPWADLGVFTFGLFFLLLPVCAALLEGRSVLEIPAVYVSLYSHVVRGFHTSLLKGLCGPIWIVQPDSGYQCVQVAGGALVEGDFTAFTLKYANSSLWAERFPAYAGFLLYYAAFAWFMYFIFPFPFVALLILIRCVRLRQWRWKDLCETMEIFINQAPIGQVRKLAQVSFSDLLQLPRAELKEKMRHNFRAALAKLEEMDEEEE